MQFMKGGRCSSLLGPSLTMGYFCRSGSLQLTFQWDFDRPTISEGSYKQLWMIDFAHIVIGSSKTRIRKWLGSHCDYTSAYFGCLPAIRCTRGNLRRWNGRAGKCIVETDLNKHPRGTPNGNAWAKSECNLVKKKEKKSF